MNPHTRVHELSEDELLAIRNTIGDMISVEGELRGQNSRNINTNSMSYEDMLKQRSLDIPGSNRPSTPKFGLDGGKKKQDIPKSSIDNSFLSNGNEVAILAVGSMVKNPADKQNQNISISGSICRERSRTLIWMHTMSLLKSEIIHH